MKDPQGHGSNAHGTIGRTGIAITGSFSKNLKRQPTNDTDRTVAAMRNRLAATSSPGHARGLLQGIKNLLMGPR
jgi:hypothetical protein